MLGGFYSWTACWKQKQTQVGEPGLVHTHHKTISHGLQTSELPSEVQKHVKIIPCPKGRILSNTRFYKTDVIKRELPLKCKVTECKVASHSADVIGFGTRSLTPASVTFFHIRFQTPIILNYLPLDMLSPSQGTLCSLLDKSPPTSSF